MVYIVEEVKRLTLGLLDYRLFIHVCKLFCIFTFMPATLYIQYHSYHLMLVSMDRKSVILPIITLDILVVLTSSYLSKPIGCKFNSYLEAIA